MQVYPAPAGSQLNNTYKREFLFAYRRRRPTKNGLIIHLSFALLRETLKASYAVCARVRNHRAEAQVNFALLANSSTLSQTLEGFLFFYLSQYYVSSSLIHNVGTRRQDQQRIDKNLLRKLRRSRNLALAWLQRPPRKTTSLY